MPVVGLSPTQRVLYRPGVQIAYVIKDGEMRILSQVPGKCYAAARDYIRSKTMVARVMWHRDCTHISPNDGTVPRGTHPGGFWAEMCLGRVSSSTVLMIG